MTGRSITVQCAACQRDMQVGCNMTKPRLCSECRIAKYVENLTSLKQKSGAPYERNVKAIREAAERRRRGGTSAS